MPDMVLYALCTSFHVIAREIFMSVYLLSFLQVRKARLTKDKPGFQGCTGNHRFIIRILLINSFPV